MNPKFFVLGGLAFAALGLAALARSQITFILGRPYLTTVKSATQGQIQLPVLKLTTFCQTYVCRELDPNPNQAPGVAVYEWFESTLSPAQEKQYLSTLSLNSRAGMVSNVSVYSFRKAASSLTPGESKAFQALGLAVTGQSLQSAALARCNRQLVTALQSTPKARCLLVKGQLNTAQGRKLPYQLQLTADKDMDSGRFVSGLNAWIP
ncbi:hypothetical protein [Deinococcus hohokamensis]|uniref:Uncharacterized protein n=1 Tax=Deinococcus hohokamensis TaxID=309883 RepID=A0ABV9IDH8_9DEIO